MEDVIQSLGGRETVTVWVTAARNMRPTLLFAQARNYLEKESTRTILLIFGTEWDLASDTIESVDACLQPIEVVGKDYNHLSVRSAFAIVLDRLMDDREGSFISSSCASRAGGEESSDVNSGE
ncbi:RNA methyltransferase [Pajaroellobacter abortibovis]|uniref:RNA methyltransferase n=1 Tax=Pajaroellobacter abortibovis TaxID=1882918 RepID=UPI0023DDCB4A|nr:RNA methyltransferase [Pajaroellobacter abortibovis]